MNSIRRFLIAAAVLIAMSFGTAVVLVSGSYRAAAAQVCDLVDENYYKSREPEIQAWVERCRVRAEELPFFISRNQIISEIANWLAEVDVSHLALYTPDENRSLWENEAVDTGLRARNIEGHFIVWDVLAGSVGAELGFRPGDEVVTIDGFDVGTKDDVETTSGQYKIMRGVDVLQKLVQARPLSVDLSPTLQPLGDGHAVLRIQSFLARYFDREDWTKLSEKLNTFDHVIVDVRGNAGGSFPAMLRAVSSFFCEEVRIGTIFQPRNAFLNREDDLEDELSADSQLEQLEDASKLHLRTYSDYPCYDGQVTVLVDSQTNSVAEIFAEAFLHRVDSRVWGMPTAGQVVMAQWLAIQGLGNGEYSVSIPIAGYITRAGKEIEDEGVTPERFLYYDLEKAFRGTDTWLEEAKYDDDFNQRKKTKRTANY